MILASPPSSARQPDPRELLDLYRATVTSIDTGIIQQYQSKYVQYTKKSVNEFLLRYILSGQELRIHESGRGADHEGSELVDSLEQDAFEDVALNI